MRIIEPVFDGSELDNLKECFESGWVTQGPRVAEFESIVAEKHKVKHALATTSCTAGLHLSALALGLGPGDEVIVPSFTWITSANCAEYVGAKAVLVDVDPDTYNLDIAAFENAITENTRAVVAVHLFGMPANMDAIREISNKNNLYIIEDAACALGTLYKNTPIGGMGDVAVFSFHPRKVITTGEGGMITTNNESISKLIDSLRNHGSTGLSPEDKDDPKPYSMATFNNLGYNLRMSDIQAAVGVAQMSKFEYLLSERRKYADRYNYLLSEIDEIQTPVVGNESKGHSYQSYVIRVLKGGQNTRNKIMEDLSEKKIETRPGTLAVHRCGYYAEKYNYRPDEIPNATLCAETTITLPLFHNMNESDLINVVDSIKASIFN